MKKANFHTAGRHTHTLTSLDCFDNFVLCGLVHHSDNTYSSSLQPCSLEPNGHQSHNWSSAQIQEEGLDQDTHEIHQDHVAPMRKKTLSAFTKPIMRWDILILSLISLPMYSYTKHFAVLLKKRLKITTPLANSTMIRLPSTSRPFKLYLASSASRGSLNSCY